MRFDNLHINAIMSVLLRRVNEWQPFCSLEKHLIPRLSSYWKSHLPQGLMGCICALRRFIFPCGGKKTQTRSTKCTSKVTFFIFLMYVWKRCSVLYQNYADKYRLIEKFSVWLYECRGKHFKKSVNPAHKNMWREIFLATVFSFLFLQVWCLHRDYYSLFNLSDQLHLLKIFSFVVRSFCLIQAKMVYGASETKNIGWV